jgi:hypothetical protein
LQEGQHICTKNRSGSLNTWTLHLFWCTSTRACYYIHTLLLNAVKLKGLCGDAYDTAHLFY